MEKNIESKIDWKKITLPVAGAALIGGLVLGVFVVKPMWDKARANKLAAKKKGSDKSDTKKA